MSQNKCRVLLAGAGGYGRFYLEALADPEIMNESEFVGAVEPFLAEDVGADLEKRGVPVFETLEDAYQNLEGVDLTCLVIPLPYHLPYVRTAVEYGSHVLCEKPATPVMEQLLPMIMLEETTDLLVAIGFQWSFSPAMLACKKDFIDGVYGRPLSAKALVLWPRPQSYFKRGSGWGGKRFAKDGSPINDSVASNAAAHYLHNLYFMMGKAMQTSAMPAEMRYSLARANEIENYDTVCIEATLDNGANLLYYASHAVKDTQNPIIEYRFEKAVVRYDCDRDTLTAYDPESGETLKSYGTVGGEVKQKLKTMIGLVNADGEKKDVPCTPCTAMPHVYTVDRLFLKGEIAEFPKGLKQFYSPDDPMKKGVFISGLGEAMRDAFDKNRFFDSSSLIR